MGGRLATYLAQPIRGAQTAELAGTAGGGAQAGRCPARRRDTRVSVAIKYLTQSTWSHAMFYIGDAQGPLLRANHPGSWSNAADVYGEPQ